MRLQIAMDLDNLDKFMAMAKEVAPYVDIFEVGTPMIVKYGCVPIVELKKLFPTKCVLADTKIVDGGAYETGFVMEAGADIITVLAMAENETIEGTARVAHQYGKEVYVDLICVEDIATRANELEAMGVDYIGVHTPYDVQHTGRSPLEDLRILKSAVKNTRIAVAGGIKLNTIGKAYELGADTAIVGGALTTSPNPGEEAKKFRELIDSFN